MAGPGAHFVILEKQQLNAVAGEHEGTPSQVHLAGFDVGYDDEEQEVAIMTKEWEFNAALIQCFVYCTPNFNIDVDNIEKKIIITILRTTIVKVAKERGTPLM